MNFSTTITLTGTKTISVAWLSVYDVLLKIVTPTGTVLHINSGYNSGVFTSPDTTPIDITAFPFVTGSGNPLPGTYTIYWKENNTKAQRVNTGISTFYFCTAGFPTLTFEETSDCIASTLKSVDTTDYSLVCNGVITPASSTGQHSVHTIKYPTTITDAPIPADIVLTSDSLNTTNVLPAEIWTGNYMILLAVNVQWDVVDSLGDTMTIVTLLTGVTVNQVVCASDCLCAMLLCVSAVYDRYVDLTTNGGLKTEIDRYQQMINKLALLIALYFGDIICGNEAAILDVCAKIKTILNDENCNCDTVGSIGSKLIPISGGSGSGIGTTTYINQILPPGNYPRVASISTSLGNNNDFVFDNSGTGNAYMKVSGSWVLQYSLPTGADAPLTYELASNDLTVNGTTAAIAEKLLGTYTMLPDMWGSDGSILKYSIGILLGKTSNKRNIRIEMTDGVTTLDVTNFEVDFTVTDTNKYLDFVIEVNKASVSSQPTVITASGAGLITNMQRDKQAYTFDLTKNLTLNVYGENYVAAANDVVLQNLKVEQDLMGVYPTATNIATGEYTVKVELTSAEVKALFTVPKLVAVAPGAGKAIRVIDAFSKPNPFVSAAYATDTDLWVGHLIADKAQVYGSSVLSATKDCLVPMTPFFNANNTNILENSALYIFTKNAPPDTGDSTWAVYITYKIITL